MSPSQSDNNNGRAYRQDRAARVRLWRDLHHPEIKDLRKAVRGYNMAMAAEYKRSHGETITIPQVRKTKRFKKALRESYEGDFSDIYDSDEPDDWGKSAQGLST